MNPTSVGSDPISLIVLVTLMGALPLICVASTSFLKFSVVLSILRNRHQVPGGPGPQSHLRGLLSGSFW